MQRNILGMVLFVLLTSLPASTWAYNLNIRIDTSSLAGTKAMLAFDFIDGDDVSNNIVELSDLQIDGHFDPDLVKLEGDVSRPDPTSAKFKDKDSLSELLAPVTLGNWISFNLQSTNQHDANSLLSDVFSFYILNGTGFQSLFATSDKNGSDALFSIDLDGSGNGLAVCTAIGSPASWIVQPVPVPLPGAFALMIAPLILGAWTSGKRDTYPA